MKTKTEKAIDNILKAVLLIPFCVTMFIYGGSKREHGDILFPASIEGEVAYLIDNGSALYQDEVNLNFLAPLVTDDATIYVDSRPYTSTNDEEWVTIATYTLGDIRDTMPVVIDYPNAIDYDWFIYTDWTPGETVQTNGVLHADWMRPMLDDGTEEGLLWGVPIQTDVEWIEVDLKGENE
jgi:hypothetical protein